MLIALLSDSHDSVPNLRAVLELLAPHQPNVYLHLGDLCSPDLLELFAGLPKNAFHFVLGNGDYDRSAAHASAVRWGFVCHGRHGSLALADRRVAFLHGDDHGLLHQLIASQEYDYVLHGHTHRWADTREGKTRIINPGALYRAPVKTVALLDVGTDKLMRLALPEP